MRFFYEINRRFCGGFFVVYVFLFSSRLALFYGWILGHYFFK
jgi:hypothetical protein